MMMMMIRYGMVDTFHCVNEPGMVRGHIEAILYSYRNDSDGKYLQKRCG